MTLGRRRRRRRSRADQNYGLTIFLVGLVCVVLALVGLLLYALANPAWQFQ
jgi:cell division septal protein FtsQ